VAGKAVTGGPRLVIAWTSLVIGAAWSDPVSDTAMTLTKTDSNTGGRNRANMVHPPQQSKVGKNCNTNLVPKFFMNKIQFQEQTQKDIFATSLQKSQVYLLHFIIPRERTQREL
jgi:hypothetical protein